MQVKTKIFPYPIINHNQEYSNYLNKSFDLVFEAEEDECSYILSDCKFETDSALINRLYDEGKIGVILAVECSATVYRNVFPLAKIGKNFRLDKVDFTEKVDISMFAFARENFILSSDEFDPDYNGIEFEIEKYDIVAANDGFNVYFKHEQSENNLVQSIFSVIPGPDMAENEYVVEYDTGRKISITLSENDYGNYKIIYTVPVYKEVFFNMLLVPALIEGLSQCKNYLNEGSRDLDDVGNRYIWFRSIQSAYKKLKGEDLAVQDFLAISPVSLAQLLLGKPLGFALKKLVAETNKTTGGNDNE